MLGDAAQPAESDESQDAAATGPRHAVPRKPLLTRLHVPAGKAVALAAMPTAVLMGMGFTPHFAQADEMPKAPFKPGPCVSRADTPPPTASATPKPGTTPSPKAKAAGPAPTAATGDSAPATTKPAPQRTEPTPSPTGSGVVKSTAVSGSSSTTASSPEPSAGPAASTSTDSPDPLGLGGLLGGLLSGGTSGTPSTQSTTAPPSPAPSPSATSAPKPAPEAPASPAASTPAPSGSSSGSSGNGSTSTAKTPKSALSSTVDAAKKIVESGKNAAEGATPGATDEGGKAVPLDGSQSYPCPAYDAKALADATVEGGIPLLPDQPFTLKTTRLALHGLSYHGIVKVRTWSGQVKDVLKFTATGIDIDNLWQIVDAPNGTHTWVKSRAGATSTFSNGTVTLYTESLTGNLLGVVPVKFTPQAPPPLTLPELFFTDATVVNAGQFGGDLYVPGMHVIPGQP